MRKAGGLYNHLLERRKTAWEERQELLSYHQQATTLPTVKQQRPTLAGVHSQVLQNVAMRIDLAFKAFFRRVKAGEKPGSLRFRGPGRYDSLTDPQYGNGCQLTADVLKLLKVGAVRVVVHRPLEGTPKTCTVRRTATGNQPIRRRTVASVGIGRKNPLPCVSMTAYVAGSSSIETIMLPSTF